MLTSKETISKSNNNFELVISDMEDNGFFSTRMRNGFFSDEQLLNMISEVNAYGHMDVETGQYLRELVNGGEIIYYKQFNMTDLDSIMGKGIYLNGNTSMGVSNSPRSISEINLENTVYRASNLYTLVSGIKHSNGFSAGGNPIDACMILRVPITENIDEIAYQIDGSYAIRPEYIDGYFTVDKNHNVSKYVTREEYYKKTK